MTDKGMMVVVYEEREKIKKIDILIKCSVK